MESNLISLDSDYSKLQTFQIRDVVLIRYLILSILGFVGMLIIVLIGFGRWQFALNNFGPAVIWRWINPIVWIALGLGIIGITGLVFLLRVGRQEIQLSPEAFTWKKGSSLKVYKWDDFQGIYISSVRYGILDFVWSEKTELGLQLHEGKRLRVSNAFDDIENLLNTVKHYLYPMMFERLKREFNQGEPLSFGPLLLTTQGVVNGRKPLRWHEIEEVLLEQGYLQIQPSAGSDNPGLSVPVHKIPNVELCIQLLRHFGSQP